LKGGSGRACLPRHLRFSSRGIGPARLGGRLKAFDRRYRRLHRGKLASRYCVRGGGRFEVAARRGRISLVASNVRGHRSAKRLRHGTRRKLRAGVFARRPFVYGVRGGKVRFAGVVSRRELAHPRMLVKRLRWAHFR
jgi:hypothetical protein